MRKLILMALMALPLLSRSQEKGDTKVIVTDSLSAKENYSLAGRALLEQGFELAVKEESFLHIQTKPLAFRSPLKAYVIIDVLCSDGKIVIKGQDKLAGAKKKDSVYNPEVSESVAVFGYYEKLAEALPGKITYTK